MLDLLEGTYNCSFDVFLLVFLYAMLCFQHVSAYVVVCIRGVIFFQLCWFAVSFSGVGRHGNPPNTMNLSEAQYVQQNSSQRPGVLKPSIGKWICLPSSAPRPYKKDHVLDDLGKLALEEFHSKCNVQRLIIC